MKNKDKTIHKSAWLMILIIGFMLITGGVFVNSLDSLGTFKQGSTINISQVCSDATYITLSSVSYPNSSIAVGQINMTSLGSGEFNYIFTNTSTIGMHQVRGISDGCDKTFATYFTINYSGDTLSTASAFLYIGLLTLLVVLFLLAVNGISQLPSGNEKDEYGEIMSINNLKYFKGLLFVVAWALLIAISFIASNIAFAYLNSEMLGQLFFKIFQILGWLIIPFILFWLIWLFVNIFKDKEFKRMIERGIM